MDSNHHFRIRNPAYYPLYDSGSCLFTALLDIAGNGRNRSANIPTIDVTGDAADRAKDISRCIDISRHSAEIVYLAIDHNLVRRINLHRVDVSMDGDIDFFAFSRLLDTIDKNFSTNDGEIVTLITLAVDIDHVSVVDVA